MTDAAWKRWQRAQEAITRAMKLAECADCSDDVFDALLRAKDVMVKEQRAKQAADVSRRDGRAA